MTAETDTPQGKPDSGARGSCERPTCCHCFEPCTEDDATSDDDDRVYVCQTCVDKFYREWHEAEQAELVAWLAARTAISNQQQRGNP
jgi:hypothetical protein